MEKATQEEIKEYHRLREKYGKFQETIALKVYYIQKKMLSKLLNGLGQPKDITYRILSQRKQLILSLKR